MAFKNRFGAGQIEVESHNIDPDRVNSAHIGEMAVENQDLTQLALDAKQATECEKNMTLKQAFLLYKRAALFSLIFSTSIVMEGYDTALIASFFAFPSFQQKYGEFTEGHGHQISAKWQSGLTNAAFWGGIIGLGAAGWSADKIGYRKTMLWSLAFMVASIFIPFFAPNLLTLVAGNVVQGIPWGIFQGLTTAYASEVCPVALRAYLTTYINLCWVMGQLIATGVLAAFLRREDQWAYRMPFAMQWLWPLPIMIGVLFAPESPWFHVRKGNVEEAKKSLGRLISPRHAESASFSIENTIAMMIHTNEIEKQSSTEASYKQCFEGVDLRRTEIVCLVMLIQTACGSGLIGFSIYFFQQAGLTTNGAFNMGMVQYALGAAGTILSWFTMNWWGRRTIYCWGLFILFALLLVVGLLGLPPPVENGPLGWAIGGVLVFYTFVYDLSIGPVCYSLVSELSSTRLKAKSIVLARIGYNLASIVNNVLTPQMINPGAWNWGPKTGFFWAGVCAICFTWAYFRLPEPKGRTYGELDVLFENKVSARKFAVTTVDQYSSEHHKAVVEGSSSTEKLDKGC